MQPRPEAGAGSKRRRRGYGDAEVQRALQLLQGLKQQAGAGSEGLIGEGGVKKEQEVGGLAENTGASGAGGTTARRAGGCGHMSGGATLQRCVEEAPRETRKRRPTAGVGSHTDLVSPADGSSKVCMWVARGAYRVPMNSEAVSAS